MKRLILGILVAVFVFSIVGNCLAGAEGSGRKPSEKPTSSGDLIDTAG